MNTLFATWYREVSLNLVGVDIVARESAADTLAEGASGNEVLHLVALAYGQQTDGAADAWLREPFQKADPTFPMRGNDVEMQILAAAILEEVCRSGQLLLRVFSSYAVAVAEFRGFTCPIAEVSEAAGATRLQLAHLQRRSAPRPVSKRFVVAPKAPKALRDSIDQHAESSESGDLKKLFTEIATAAQHGLDAVHTYAEALAEWTENSMQLAREDTELLWWLLSGRSSTLDLPWSSLPTYVLAVVAARELAATSVTVPAPVRSEALLQQLIVVNSEPPEKETVAVPPLEVPKSLAFLIGEIADDADHLKVACHALAQAMLLRSWSDLP